MSNTCKHAVRFDPTQDGPMEFITHFKYGISIDPGQLILPDWKKNDMIYTLGTKKLVSADQPIYERRFYQHNITLLMVSQQKHITTDGVYTYCTVHQCLLRVKCNMGNRCLHYEERELIAD